MVTFCKEALRQVIGSLSYFGVFHLLVFIGFSTLRVSGQGRSLQEPSQGCFAVGGVSASSQAIRKRDRLPISSSSYSVTSIIFENELLAFVRNRVNHFTVDLRGLCRKVDQFANVLPTRFPVRVILQQVQLVTDKIRQEPDELWNRSSL